MDDGLQSTVHQSNADLETVGAAGGDKQHSGAYNNPSDSQYRPGIALGNEEYMPEADETIYIRIPLSVMFRNEQTHTEQRYLPVISDYKLIDGLPSDADIRIKKSYAMSFNNDTGNASWVYEILNRETSAKNCKKPIKEFGNPYHRGHLAASANHKWCREASNDANLKSNITPQHERLNLSTWKRLEERCRKFIGQNRIRNVHVYSGPLYLKDESEQTYYGILQGKKVPTHFFKVIILENDDGTVRQPECYGMPNDDPPSSELRDYIVDIEDIERVSGLTFIERRHSVRQSDEMSVTLQGEGVNSTLQNVNIKVRISS
ncbi:Endonuclease G, mitochondrial [Anabarilius grahami]|uniref:Endonuclease G, mitochondrial n=1 Tax=Anabarilius grahami TaxID=495550 RepID=A0A3N0YX10_ANAGA|nr:Endonuclease G, mitochondrial [Anabarilius grahami]